MRTLAEPATHRASGTTEASQSPSSRSESTLDIAARSLLANQAISGTVAGVVLERAFEHAFEGLFHFAVIRVGVERGEDLVARLATKFASLERPELESGRGPRANLYRWLSAWCDELSSQRLPARSPLWWKAHGESPDRFAALRESIVDRDATILELRFARGLEEDEVAFVCDLPVDAITAAVARGRDASRSLFGARPRSHDRTHEGALLEAYALDPAQAPAPRRSLRKPTLAPGTIVADRYDIEELLGAGAFADVYRARDREVTGHVVALKLLRTRSNDARSVRAALRELQHLTSVFHPSIVQLKDHGWHDDHLWFVMPLYRGETLAQRLRRGPLDRHEARRVFEQLAEALAAMHRGGVRHQDVKPENVFLANLDLDSDDDVAGSGDRVLPVLLDLGVAAKDAELVLAGTPAYFAPEVAARFARVPDPPPVGPKADVFSLALTLRQALDPASSEPIPRSAVEPFIAYRALHAPEAPSHPSLDDLRPSFARWLATSPDKRPTAEQFHRELAVLTEKDERRARRNATLRWALPVAATVFAIFLAVVAELSREAAVSRAEALRASERADRARDRALSISQSLDVQSARRLELEGDVARLEDEYQRSRMTREQLASRLARTEGELSILGDRDRTHVARLRQQAEEYTTLDLERARLGVAIAAADERIASLTDTVGRERSRANGAEENGAHLTEELESTRRALEVALARLNEVQSHLATLERRRHELRSTTAQPSPPPTATP